MTEEEEEAKDVPNDNGIEEENDKIWAIGPASRTRVLVDSKSSLSNYCRLFYKNGIIEAVAYDDHDDSNAANNDEESYREKMKDENRVALDSFNLDDVIGAELEFEFDATGGKSDASKESGNAVAKLNIFAYPPLPKAQSDDSPYKGQRRAVHRHYLLDPRCCEDFADVQAIVRSIRNLCGARSAAGVPWRYLVVLNPFSGGDKSGRARNVYETMTEPMLRQAGVECDLFVTEYVGHAKERMQPMPSSSISQHKLEHNSENNSENKSQEQTRDIATYDAIIAMGGDGVLFEVFQGIQQRSDGDALLSKLKFGVVGCGTSNGLAKSILHWSGENYGQLESIFLLCKGHTSPLDISTYQLANAPDTRYLSALSFSWGLIADVDLESEWLRCLGSLRFDLWAAWRILCFKTYRARFSYLPPEGCGGGSENDMPLLGDPVPKEWVTMEDDFVVFWVCQTTHAAYDTFTLPKAKMNDGLFHILVVKSSCPRFRLIEMLLKISTGGHIDSKHCEVVDCLAYRLEPLTDNSYNDIDGELVEAGPLQACFKPINLQFFAGHV